MQEELGISTQALLATENTHAPCNCLTDVLAFMQQTRLQHLIMRAICFHILT